MKVEVKRNWIMRVFVFKNIKIMDWIKITEETNFEEIHEVLAYNGRDFIVGWVDENKEGMIVCESDGELLEDVTHYALLIKPE